MDHYRQTHTAILYGSSRASLVRTLPKSAYKFSKVVEHNYDLLSPDSRRYASILAILVNARGDRFCVHHDVFWDVYKEQKRLFYQRWAAHSTNIAFFDDAILGGDDKYESDDRGEYVLPVGADDWRVALPAGPYVLYITHFRYVPPTPHGEFPEFPEAMATGASGFFPDGRGIPTWQALYDPALARRIPGRGTAAIGEDLRAVIGMQDGRLLVFEGLTGEPRIEPKLPYPITDLSLPGDDYAVVSTAGDKHTVHRLGPDGKEKWTATVDFPLSQPPVDGGGGTLYLAGQGLAAARDGKLLFSRKSKETVRMTCFDDGTCAIAEGHTLRITGAQGQALHTFTTPADEAIAAPPAIGGDGSVWIATEKAVYAAR